MDRGVDTAHGPRHLGARLLLLQPGQIRRRDHRSPQAATLVHALQSGTSRVPRQNLAMVELKILIAQLLFNFSFTLSPNYIHSPSLRLVIELEHGVELSVAKLSRD
ncbi:Fn3_like domain-containing protein [Psidium guajava]|nr:Fn3_like domain-containing protein [Psidium guajava]